MPDSVHGHVVLRLLLAAQPAMSREELRAESSRRFGADATYHTCSTDSLSIDQLVDFFLSRGKVSLDGETLVPHREEMCAEI